MGAGTTDAESRVESTCAGWRLRWETRRRLFAAPQLTLWSPSPSLGLQHDIAKGLRFRLADLLVFSNPLQFIHHCVLRFLFPVEEEAMTSRRRNNSWCFSSSSLNRTMACSAVWSLRAWSLENSRTLTQMNRSTSPEHVGVGAALHLAHEAPLGGVQER